MFCHLSRSWLLKRRWPLTQCMCLPRKTPSMLTLESAGHVWRTPPDPPAPSGSAWWPVEDRSVSPDCKSKYFTCRLSQVVWFLDSLTIFALNIVHLFSYMFFLLSRELRKVPSARGLFPLCRTSGRKFPSSLCSVLWDLCLIETSLNTSSMTLMILRWWRWYVTLNVQMKHSFD